MGQVLNSLPKNKVQQLKTKHNKSLFVKHLYNSPYSHVWYKFFLRLF